ncbi:MAG: 2,3-bisphosphoglycerate-independent phosphoglycerate mutase [Deltaproteobacteria bacterium]|jgi:2,3-bisphosphoglycerate-independent phosphoglycerate mutase|nr:2,3-bisphosphoglycerate-independent phosphoglycerate mutase [Deltaproteobacteria bacterium]
MSNFELNKLAKFAGRKGPQVIVVMDGVGLGRENESNAVFRANTPTLKNLFAKSQWCKLTASGLAVGLPSDEDMGNSEVGHNAIGAGRIFSQGAKLVAEALVNGSLYSGPVWQNIIQQCVSKNSTLHFIGLLSDGNVHSNIAHLFAMLKHAAEEQVQKVRVHVLLDGRDVDPTSALNYVQPLEKLLAELSIGGFDYKIASGGGRMKVTMDRYNADWTIVERGWKAHVLGEGRAFNSAEQAIETYRAENHEIQDQNLLEFVVVDEKANPVGTINDGDSVIFYNFRGDRAIEISAAFEEREFKHFNRKRVPNVLYAGMMQYDGDLKIPKSFLVTPSMIDRTMTEYLVHNGLGQFACSETQKFGHVTYFWNGNRSGVFDSHYETYQEIPSDLVPFNERPWMKSSEITDITVEAILSGKYRQLRINYPNGDMVGHTGSLDATIIGVEAVDLNLARILKAVEQTEGLALITADHGNADEMYEWDKKTNAFKINKNGVPVALMSHTLNPVPFIIYDPKFNGEYKIKNNGVKFGLSNIAATAINLLGFVAPAEYNESLIEFL